MADLFSRRGWRQVGFIGENRENFSTRQRYDAFIAQTSGMTVTSRFCDGGGYQAGYRAPEKWLLKTRDASGAVCATDMLALGAQDGLRGRPPPRCRPSSALTISRRRTGNLPAHHRSAEYRPAGHHAVDLLMTRIARFQPALAPSRSAGETNYSS